LGLAAQPRELAHPVGGSSATSRRFAGRSAPPRWMRTATPVRCEGSTARADPRRGSVDCSTGRRGQAWVVREVAGPAPGTHGAGRHRLPARRSGPRAGPRAGDAYLAGAALLPRVRSGSRRASGWRSDHQRSLPAVRVPAGRRIGRRRPARARRRPRPRWQWPDGGWNCHRKPDASMSSVCETLLPMRGLSAYAEPSGDRQAHRAGQRAAEVFLDRRGALPPHERTTGPR